MSKQRVLTKRQQMTAKAALGKVFSSGQRRWSFPFLSNVEIIFRFFCSMLRLANTGETCACWREFNKGPWRWLGDWSIWHMRRCWKCWHCSAWKRLRKICVYKFLMGSNDEDILFSLVPSDQARGNMQEVIPFTHKRMPFLTVAVVKDWKCLPRGWCHHSWKSSKAIWTSSQSISSALPCLSRGVGSCTSRCPFQLQPFCGKGYKEIH